MNQKALRDGCASRQEEVSCKQHRQGAKESQATFYRNFVKCLNKVERTLCKKFAQ